MNRQVDDELWATLRRQYRQRVAAADRHAIAAGSAAARLHDEEPGR